MDINKIYNLDCIEEMINYIDNESIDLIIADPPFNLNKVFDKKLSLQEYYDWCEKWIRNLFEKLKPTGSIFIMTAQEHVGRMSYYLDYYGYFRNLIIWFNSSMPVKNRFCRGYQPILYYVKDERKHFTFNYGIEKRDSKAVLPWGRKNKAGSIKDVWDDIPFVSGGCMASKEAILEKDSKKKMHSAQMPIKLADRMILYCSNVRDIVLDPFVGSGTVPLSAKNLERNFIGFETDKRYYDLANERLNDYK
jgi:site-specific DNA-methyltransferase (adenine-specific)